jgi:maltose O-acetyltransferase
MLTALKTFKFYLKYYLTNHVINRIPFHAVRLAWYRHFMGIKIGENSQIWMGCRFFGDAIAQIEIGAHTALSTDVLINASAPVKIGDHVVIAHGVQILTTGHDSRRSDFTPLRIPVTIESHAYIGNSAIILKGVILGEGATVGVGSVVFQDVKPLTVVAGNPARVCGTRPPLSPPTTERQRPPLFC